MVGHQYTADFQVQVAPSAPPPAAPPAAALPAAAPPTTICDGASSGALVQNSSKTERFAATAAVRENDDG